MCTLSWLYSATGYQLLFNRDEQKSRELAQHPQYFYYSDSLKALMPIDPRGKGSWISVNSYGLVLALLNFYQGQVPAGKLLSRGQIIKQAANYKSAHQVEDFLRGLPLIRYPPFSLIVFDRALSPPAQFTWTGIEFNFTAAHSPVISSGVDFERVIQARMAEYRSCLEAEHSLTSLNNFHKSHQPRPSAYSVCMHRDDAETVSHTQIVVGKDKIEMLYTPGALCVTAAAEIKRYSFPRLY